MFLHAYTWVKGWISPRRLFITALRTFSFQPFVWKHQLRDPDDVLEWIHSGKHRLWLQLGCLSSFSFLSSSSSTSSSLSYHSKLQMTTFRQGPCSSPSRLEVRLPLSMMSIVSATRYHYRVWFYHYCEVNTCRKDHITMHAVSSYFTPFRGGRFICLFYWLSRPAPLFPIYILRKHLTHSHSSKFRCSKEVSKRGENPIFGLFVMANL